MKSFKNPHVWLYGLVAAAIGGGATSVSAWIGMVAAQQMGANVVPVDFNALKIIFISGCVVNLFFYLKQSPLPPLDSDALGVNGEVKKKLNDNVSDKLNLGSDSGEKPLQ